MDELDELKLYNSCIEKLVSQISKIQTDTLFNAKSFIDLHFEDAEDSSGRQRKRQKDLQSWTKYFEQTSILKKNLFSSLPLANNVENVDNIQAGLVQPQHC